MTPGRRQWLRWALVGAAGSTVAGSALAGQAPAGLVWRERALILFGRSLLFSAVN
jgi:hypothetical protein